MPQDHSALLAQLAQLDVLKSADGGAVFAELISGRHWITGVHPRV
jgi:hypothetical protein